MPGSRPSARSAYAIVIRRPTDLYEKSGVDSHRAGDSLRRGADTHARADARSPHDRRARRRPRVLARRLTRGLHRHRAAESDGAPARNLDVRTGERTVAAADVFRQERRVTPIGAVRFVD